MWGISGLVYGGVFLDKRFLVHARKDHVVVECGGGRNVHGMV